ncbi:MAG: exodeoxyribonuclease VII large subunit [Candidatus Omnitrophica bacterium]|nr:exodeoxyribonuclease VII large subunit [Candidatus Omnitrophota bacterium]
MIPEKDMSQTSSSEVNGDRVYTVTEITRDVHMTLEEAFPGVWVEGELSNFKVYSSGHAYFSLKDGKSLLNCVMFKSSFSRIKDALEDGMKLLCRGRISVYDKRGQYQLYVSTLELRGQGLLLAAYEKLKKKLLGEGLFDREKKKPIPSLPLRIGVVTSSAGAAVRDILNVSRRRFPNCHITLVPVRVQGEKAAGEIAGAIDMLNEYNSTLRGGGEPAVDVMIVGRGGGSLEDLWPFNEERVARAVFDSEIPVISAVGHEVDYSIADLTADLRAPTPSAAAELCVPAKQDLERGISDLKKRLYTAASGHTEYLKNTVDSLADAYVLREPVNVLKQMEQQVDELAGTVTAGMRRIVQTGIKDLASAAGRLNALSPLAVLERGYSITRFEGKPVKTAEEVKKGDVVETVLARGRMKSRVERIIRKHPEE